LWYLKKYSSEFLKQPSYKIRIRRKNIFEQVLSNFVAANRKKFLYNKDETFIQDKIELNESYLLESLEFIKNYNRETDLFRGNIDLDLYYEDLYITDTYTIPTPKPINNEELVNWAHNILKDKI
jgi:hypothetical protein